MSMEFLQQDVNGDPNVGMYVRATERFAISGSPSVRLPVETVHATYNGMPFSGIFFAANSRAILVPADISREDEEKLVRLAPLIKIKSRYNVLGNMILINDRACLASPLLRLNRTDIEHMAGVECEFRPIGGINLVGSVAFLTNAGIAVHPSVSEDEMDFLEDFFKVKAGVLTIGGSIFIGSGLAGNSSFMLVSPLATGVELSRIGEIFEKDI